MSETPILSEGLRIGSYILEEKIGDGGEAEVWRVHSDENTKLVSALKIRPPVKLTSKQETDKQKTAFKRENDQWVEFSNKSMYIVNIYDVFTEIVDDEWVLFCIRMEYSPMGDLHNAIQDGSIKKHLNSEILFINFLLNIIAGVEAGHRSQRLHCDIKPKNILLFHEGDTVTPKLSDFGVTRASWEPVQGMTAGYAAPEMAPKSPATPESDIYALGITFYELFYAVVLDSQSDVKTASEYDSGRDFKKYLRSEFGSQTDVDSFNAVPYLTLMSNMAEEEASARPSLDSIKSMLNLTKQNVLKKGPQYKAITPTDTFLWNPAVHQRLNEEMYYFLIRGGNPILDVKEILVDIDRVRAHGFSLRTVSGGWDYVMRVWLPDDKHSVKDTYKAIARNGRSTVGLHVQSFSLHTQPTPIKTDKNAEVEILREIESISGSENSFSALKRKGFVTARLNDSESVFRVTLLVKIAPDFQKMADVFGRLIKDKLEEMDPSAKEISYYEVQSTNEELRDVRLVIKFMHKKFVVCRKSLFEIFRSLAEFGDYFSFSTLFDMNAEDDVLSDDGRIIKSIEEAH